MAQKIAEKLGIRKRSVNRIAKKAAAAIGENIDLDRDTPEELERKADKCQHAERKVVRLKRRKPSPRVEDATPPAEPHAAEIDSPIEAWLNAFDALGRTYQLRLVYHACIRLGLDPLKMASPAAFGLADEEPELAEDRPADIVPGVEDAAVDSYAEQQDDAMELSAEDLQDAGAAVFQAAEQEPEVAVNLPAEVPLATDAASEVQPEQPDEAAGLGAEDVQNAEDDLSEAVDQEPNGTNLDNEHLQDAGVGGSDAADEEPGGATKCAYCTMELYSSDERVMIYGRLYHADLCAKFAKPPIAIAA